MHVTRHDRFRLISACAVATVLLAGLTAPGSAFAQASRMGGNIEVIPQSASSRFPAVAYDAVSDSYLVVTGVAKVSARFISAAGVPLGPADSINTAGPGAAGVACSAAVNACLVAWIQEPTTIMGRLLRSNGGELLYLTNPFPITQAGAKLTSSAPGVAVSASGEFLVAWTDLVPHSAISGQRVTANGSISGGVINIASTRKISMLPSLTYNSTADEYAVAYQYETKLDGGVNHVALRRVKPGTGALIGDWTSIYSGPFAQYPEIAYNSTDNQYLAITWGGLVITGGLADGTGQPLTGGVPQVIAANGIGDGIGLAYNPVSNTYLAVYQSINNAEVWAVEVSKTGIPGDQFQLTAWGAINNLTSSTQPSAAASTVDRRFLGVNSAGYGRIVGNMARTATIGGPRVTLSGDLSFGQILAGQTASKIISITNSGSAFVTVTGITYPAGFSSEFTAGIILPGATQNITVRFAPTALTTYGGTITVHVDPSTATVTTPVSGTGATTAIADFDGDFDADIAVYRPSTGEWFVRGQFTKTWGGPGFVAVPGDYNGDRSADIVVYETATGRWFFLDDVLNPIQFGEPGDLPVPGDYDGDGDTDLAVYRPSNGGWYVRNQPAIEGFGGPGYVPVPADYNGDGTVDAALYRLSTGTWYVYNQFTVQFGEPGDRPVAGDYNGDRTADVAVYRPTTGAWYVRNQFAFSYGSQGDLPVPRDYNGDGRTDIAVYRPSSGQWFVKGQSAVQFGSAGDIPLPRGLSTPPATPGDYDGDGVADVTVYRPSTGGWFVRNKLAVQFGDPGDRAVPADYNGDGAMDVAVFRPATGQWFVRNQFATQFGDSTDVPVPGDYNGDGVADVAVFRPSTGTWFVKNQLAVQFGDPGDIPVPGDYNSDGVTDLAVFRPSNGTWYVRGQLARQFGDSGDIPVPGDYNGDSRADLAVYRPSTGQWFVYNQLALQFGDAGDMPVPGDFSGDGRTDIAVYRPSTGTWFVRNVMAVQFGSPGDLPAVGIIRTP